jgi:hypothetical protein
MPKQWESSKHRGELPAAKPRIIHQTENGRRNVGKFFNYWRELSPEHAQLVEFRVYRLWPKCDVKQVHPEAKSVEWEKFDGPIHEAVLINSLIGNQSGETMDFDHDDYEGLFNERYGAGKWELRINEKGVSGSILQAYFVAGDLDLHPPKLDYRMIVRGWPGNEDYIRWLENQNIPLPWTAAPKNEEEEEDMAANEALKAMTETVISQSKQNAELSEKIADARIEAIENAQPDEERFAVNESIKMVTQTAHEANTMAFDLVKQHAGKQYDPVEMLRATAEFLKTTGQGGVQNGGGQMIEMTKLLLDGQKTMYESLMQGLRSEIDTLKTVALRQNSDGSFGPGTAVARPVEQQQPKTLMEQVKEFHAMSELLGLGRRRRHDDDDDKPERAPEKSLMVTLAENATPIMGGLTAIGLLVANMIYNSRLKPGEQPQNPTEALAKQNGVPAPVAQPGAPGPQPAPQQPQASMNPWEPFLRQIEPAFLNHFTGGPDLNGYTFAYWLKTDGTGGSITPQGNMIYMQVKEKLGMKGFDLLIRNHFPIWSKIQGLPQQYEKFLKEFFTYDEWQAEQEEGGGKAA